jgi:gamma-glutamyltranspeptidase/glutathione hydrolase
MQKFKVFILLLLIVACTASFANPLPLPKKLIPLNSPEGTLLFKQSHKAGYFWQLDSNFVTQDNLAFCSIASSVMVLNTLGITAPSDPSYGPYRVFTQNNFFTPSVEAVLPVALVKKQGSTLQQISQALATYPIKVTAVHANESSLENFRKLAINMIDNDKGYIIVNFLRTSLGEEGGGHMSPLAMYDKKSDRFLMLDVARYRYGAAWIKTQDLWNAMNTFDKDANAYRGFVIISRLPFANSHHSMVVTNNRWATEAAHEILSTGGNAVDAAISAGFVLGLTEPGSSGIGGGGYALIYSTKNQENVAYDGREVAPHSANSNWFLDNNGKPLSYLQAVMSAKSVGVPSEVALFYKMHQEHGQLPWSKLLAPAIRLAKKGYPMSPLLQKILKLQEPYLKNNPEVRKVFFDGDKIKLIGGMIHNPAYAETLQRIAKNPQDFYQGKLAKEIIAVINHEAKSNLFNLHDFSNYRVKKYAALCTDFRSRYEICSVPPSSSGGVALQELIGIYAQKYQGHDYHDPKWMYYFLEASKLAYADRNLYIADPDFIKIPTVGLLSKSYWVMRSQLIGPAALATPVPAGLPEGASQQNAPDASVKRPGTTSIAVVDKEGNAITMTVTIEGPFGSHIFTHGFFLNNELTDFSFIPKNEKGQWIANRVEAGKRPRSSIAPAMVFKKNNHELYALSGSPGGSEIICYVAKNLILMLDMNMSPEQANASPNLCALNQSPVIENTTTPFPAIHALQNMGEKIERKNLLSGVTNILRQPEGGWLGSADPRREGVAKGE